MLVKNSKLILYIVVDMISLANLIKLYMTFKLVKITFYHQINHKHLPLFHPSSFICLLLRYTKSNKLEESLEKFKKMSYNNTKLTSLNVGLIFKTITSFRSSTLGAERLK